MEQVPSTTEQVRRASVRLVSQLETIEADLGTEPEEQSFALLAAAIDELLVTCRATDLWGPANRLPSSELWNVAGGLLERGWLANRARTKPRGYAGDYELLARIFENRRCDDPLGRHLDRYFQQQAAPVAVRNRMAMMRDWIVEASVARPSGATKWPLRVAIVGSALGLDVREALLKLDSRAREAVAVTLMDVDPAALDFARTNLGPLLPPERLIVVSTNLFRLPERPNLAQPLEGADLLFCPGLLDYLDDATATAMLRLLWERLSSGGRLTVFQFAPHNPTRAFMEWIGNWYLIYRDERELRSLAEAAGIPLDAMRQGAEAQRVNLFLTAVRG